VLELDLERQVKKSAEAAKTDLEMSFKLLGVFLKKELKKNREIGHWTLCQKDAEKTQ
jgi:hypothetical protein